MAKRPAAALGDDTPHAKLERKIRVLCRLIVRGKWAKYRIEVKVYITLRIFSIIIAACAGAGLIADKVNQNLTVQTGWAFWGALLVLAFGILVQVSDVLNIE